MSPFPALTISLAAIACLAAGCGPYEYTTPPLEPEGPAIGSGTAAHMDTSQCVAQGTEIVPEADAGGPQECCAGLTRVGVFKGSILRLDTCEPESDGHAFCIKCGDGHCGVGENMCTCASDCKWP